MWWNSHRKVKILGMTSSLVGDVVVLVLVVTVLVVMLAACCMLVGR